MSCQYSIDAKSPNFFASNSRYFFKYMVIDSELEYVMIYTGLEYLPAVVATFEVV